MNIDLLRYIKKGLVYAIIPARSGSKGVKGKNIRILNGFPMIAYTIAASKLSNKINRVIVSTDSEEYADIACKYGADVPFLRPAEISGDKSTDIEFMEHAIGWLGENEHIIPELWVHLRPTTPLRESKVIDEAITVFKNNEQADSLRSAHYTELSPFKWFTIDNDGCFRTLNGVAPDEANRPRQDYPNVYIPDGYVDVLRSSYIIKNDLMHGKNVLAFKLGESVDVDNIHDIEELEIKIKDCNNDVIGYLREHK